VLESGGSPCRGADLAWPVRSSAAVTTHPTDRYSLYPHFDGDGRAVLAHACGLGAEGIVSKCRTAPYRAGSRSDDWRKTKCVRRQEFVVGGFTEPEGSREGVGSILVGYYEGRALRFAGKVGTGRGWNDAFGRKLRGLLESIAVDATPFDPPPPGALRRLAHWEEPRLVAEVQFTEWTGDGKIRHPSLQGFRADKRATDVRPSARWTLRTDLTARLPLCLARHG
jgi:bifunctional non-homologous end joining protein LigD